MLSKLKNESHMGKTTMKAMTKIAIVATGILSLGTLTACQTTTAPQQKDPRSFKGNDHKRMSPEQRAAFKEHHAERKQAFQQMKTACDGKAVGTPIQIKAGERVIDGTCNIHFKADRKEMKQARAEQSSMHKGDRSKRGEHHPMRGEVRGFNQHRTEPLTDAKRAELTKAYDLRLAQRQATQQAISKACVGQNDGKAVQIKIAEKSVSGTCEVRFYPKAAPSVVTQKAI